MILTRIAAIALLLITLVSAVACGSSSSQAPSPTPKCNVSHEQAIVLAQDAFEQTLLQISCSEGRDSVQEFMNTYNYSWGIQVKDCGVYNCTSYLAQDNPEDEYILVTYSPPGEPTAATYWWRVYCDTRNVEPLGNTSTHLQLLVSAFSQLCHGITQSPVFTNGVCFVSVIPEPDTDLPTGYVAFRILYRVWGNEVLDENSGLSSAFEIRGNTLCSITTGVPIYYLPMYQLQSDGHTFISVYDGLPAAFIVN